MISGANSASNRTEISGLTLALVLPHGVFADDRFYIAIQESDSLRYRQAGSLDRLAKARPMFDLLRGGARKAAAGILGGNKKGI